MKTRFIYTGFLILVNTVIYGQQSVLPDTIMLEELVISATRQTTMLGKTPEVIRVISSREIEALNVNSTGDILQYISGVSVESGTGSGLPKRSIVSLNGFPANYTLIMVDGVRLLSDHIHSGQNVDLIPPSGIERIEVIKGSASAQYGSDAMGGIINIITKKCKDKPELTIASSYGNYETFSTEMALLSPVNKKIKTSTFVKYEQSDGQPILEPAHRIDNMGYTQFVFLNSLDFDISKRSHLNASLFYNQNKMDWRDDEKYGHLIVPGIQIETSLSDNLKLNSRINYSKWIAEQSDEMNELIHPELFITWNRLKNNRITLGTDFRYMNFRRTNVLEKDQKAGGIFLQDEISMRNFEMYLALRCDKVEEIDLVLSPKIGMLYKPYSFFRIRGSIGRGFHAPSVQELYEEGAGHGGRAYRFGNPDLKPEYSITCTLGGELFIRNDIQILMYGYYNTIDNMITPVYEGPWEENPEIDKWVRQNIHNAQILGYEISGRWNITEAIDLEGGYTYTDNENTTTGGILPYYPGRSYYTRMIMNHSFNEQSSGSAFICLRAARDRSAWNWKPTDDAEPDNSEGMITRLADYEMLNAGLKWTYHPISLFINVSNILGQDIERLDDVYTITDGEPVYRGGLILTFR